MTNEEIMNIMLILADNGAFKQGNTIIWHNNIQNHPFHDFRNKKGYKHFMMEIYDRIKNVSFMIEPLTVELTAHKDVYTLHVISENFQTRMNHEEFTRFHIKNLLET